MNHEQTKWSGVSPNIVLWKSATSSRCFFKYQFPDYDSVLPSSELDSLWIRFSYWCRELQIRSSLKRSLQNAFYELFISTQINQVKDMGIDINNSLQTEELERINLDEKLNLHQMQFKMLGKVLLIWLKQKAVPMTIMTKSLDTQSIYTVDLEQRAHKKTSTLALLEHTLHLVLQLMQFNKLLLLGNLQMIWIMTKS